MQKSIFKTVEGLAEKWISNDSNSDFKIKNVIKRKKNNLKSKRIRIKQAFSLLLLKIYFRK